MSPHGDRWKTMWELPNPNEHAALELVVQHVPKYFSFLAPGSVDFIAVEKGKNGSRNACNLFCALRQVSLLLVPVAAVASVIQVSTCLSQVVD